MATVGRVVGGGREARQKTNDSTCPFFLSRCLFPQYVVSVLSRSSGSTLSLHLAAYIHPSAPTVHVGYSLHPDSLYSWPPFQLSTSTQRAAHRRSKRRFLFYFIFLNLLPVMPFTLGTSYTEQ